MHAKVEGDNSFSHSFPPARCGPQPCCPHSNEAFFYSLLFFFFLPAAQLNTIKIHKNTIKSHSFLFSHCIGKTEGLSNQLLQLQASSLPLKQAADPEPYRLMLFQSP